MESPLQLLQTVAITQFLNVPWPDQASVKDGQTFDFIIVGGGTAGCVIANRLTEIDNFNVLLVERGGDPPLESFLPGLFPTLRNSEYDWKLYSENDNYSAQLLQNKCVELTVGKMLGGSSSLDHLLDVRGCPKDYNEWAEETSDIKWTYDVVFPYFKKTEDVKDKYIMNSQDLRSCHGSNGYLKVERELHNKVRPYLDSARELGFDIIADSNANYSLGYLQPLFTVYDGVRQSSAYAYLTPIQKRPNLFVLKNTFVTEIILENGVAVGIKATTEKNQRITLKASKEVILTAGTFNSAKLLMLAGIGPKDHLNSLGIDVVADLPVGEDMNDHISVPILHKMEKSVESIPIDPFKFPAPFYTGYVSLDGDNQPDYQTMNFVLSPNNKAVSTICSKVLGYTNEICQQMVDSNKGRYTLYTVLNLLHPKSRGRVLLRSTNPTDPPLIYTGFFSNDLDVENLANYVQHFSKVRNTTYFTKVEAELLKLNIPQCNFYNSDTIEYWRCYVLAMGTTAFHSSCTCQIGRVVDEELRVKGVKNLRVADASVFPSIISGPIKVAVLAIAEKAADLIKNSHNNDTNTDRENNSSKKDDIVNNVSYPRDLRAPVPRIWRPQSRDATRVVNSPGRPGFFWNKVVGF